MVGETHSRKLSGRLEPLDYQSFFTQSLDTLRNEGDYRIFTDILRQAGQFPRATHFKKDGTQEEIVVWCTNDYLGMSQHPAVLDATITAIRTSGVGSGGTRNISGTTHHHVELEKELANLHGKEAGLLFTSGYVSNDATLAVLGSKLPGCIFLSDERNHASIIHGIRASRAEKHVFKHNDVTDLRQKLSQLDRNAPKIIVFEAVYSMDGTIAPVQEYCDLAAEFNALTYIDEVHAVGIYGDQGGGITEREHIAHRVDIIQGTLSKTFGITGGYITGTTELVDFVRSFAPSFIFTTSLPPAIMAGALESVRYLRTHNAERLQFHTNVQAVKDTLRTQHIPFMPTDSHIIPVIIGDSKVCTRVSQDLLNVHGIYVQPINYPTVPKGTERLRIIAMPQHTPEMIAHLGDALATVWKKYDLPTVETLKLAS